jgi:hypothetical protein
MTVTISRDYYRFLYELSASQLGQATAQSIQDGGKFSHPGDPLGSLLCEVWKIDAGDVGAALQAYMHSLREACREHDITPPTVNDVLQTLPHAINTGRYPDVNVDLLIRDVTSAAARFVSEDN